MLIRKMKDEDVEALAAIEEKSFSMPWKPNDFRELMAHDTVVYVVAEDAGRIVGGAGIRNILGEGEITNVVVDPDYRGRGIGTEIVERLLAEGKLLGADSFTLEVRMSNLPAIKLYEHFGFATEGIRKNFYDYPKEDALIMWKR